MKQYYFIFNLSIFALANHSRKFILKIIMLKKGTKIYSVLRGKCPRCHEGGFFKYSFSNPASLTYPKEQPVKVQYQVPLFEYNFGPRLNSFRFG